jgi:NitT/TauT family transport system permease protein
MSARLADLPDIVHELPSAASLDITARRVPPLRRLYGNALVRRLVILVLLAALWQGYASYADNPLLFPTLTDTVRALADGLLSG